MKVSAKRRVWKLPFSTPKNFLRRLDEPWLLEILKTEPELKNFGFMFDRMQRERIVCGIQSTDVKKALLSLSSTGKEAEWWCQAASTVRGSRHGADEDYSCRD